MTALGENSHGGRRVVVTGGAGTIGSDICRLFLSLGAEVWSLDLTRSDVLGVHSTIVSVRDRKALVEAAQPILAAGGADILVNSHGLQIRSSAMDCTDEAIAEVLDVNVGGVVRCCQIFVPGMTRGGCIINVASINGLVAAKTGAIYGASKAAVMHLTRILALELAPNVRVNAVAPTVVRSAMTEDLFVNPAYERSKIAAIPLGRIAEASDVSEAVRYLASAPFVTGHTISVDGGISLA